MSKYAEKLYILRETAESLLLRLYSIKRFSSRPEFCLNDPALSKVNTVLLKKFPEFDPAIEKTQGWDTIQNNKVKTRSVYDELEPHYFTLVDAFEFKEAATSTLAEIGTGVVEMKLDDNPHLTTAFLDLFTLTVQVNLLVAEIPERKLILSMYFKVFNLVKATSEPSYQRVANYCRNLEDPIKVMTEEFRPLNTSIGKTLVHLLPVYSKIRTVQLLRKEGSINITLKPEEMAKPIGDKFHFQMILGNRMYLWIIFGFLLCPESLSLPGAIDLCKFALSESFAVPIFRNISFQVHHEYDTLFSNYKSKTTNLTKQKKLIKDVQIESVTKGLPKHRERRVFVKQELNTLLRMFQDKPTLLGPKFQLILCALAYAKEEIISYYRHLKFGVPKGYSKKITDEELKDNRISELIYLVLDITNLIRANKQKIQNYYVEYLKGADRKKIAELCDATFVNAVGKDSGIAKIVQNMVDEFGNLQLNAPKYDLKAIRLNWLRAESLLSSLTSTVPLSKFKQLTDRVNLAIQHTRFADDIDGLLREHASLRTLWYWKDAIMETSSLAIKDGPNQPLHSMAFIRLYGEFTANGTQFNPDEREEIGKQVIAIAEKQLEEVATRAVDIINEISKQYLEFDAQLQDVNAAYPLLLKRKDYKPAKDFIPPVVPGVESEFRKRIAIDKYRLYERNAWQIFHAMNEMETIIVYDTAFVPREFLRERLADNFRKFIRQRSSFEVQDDKHRVIERSIQRPSVYLKHLETYMNTIKLVENFVDLDIGELFREVLVSEVWIPALGRSGTYDWISAEETEIKYNGASVGNYVSWYGDFISKKLASGSYVFSPSRKGFITKDTKAPIKAELYTDIVELRALCQLIGPYGIKLIDRELLKYVFSNINSVKDFISVNRAALDELRSTFHNEALCNDALKKIRETDSFVLKSIALSNALSFREGMYEALRQITLEKIPYIYNSVNNCFSEYKANTFMSSELLAIDSLASDCGIPLKTADQHFKKFLSKASGSADGPLWDLLPFMYAASLHSSVWKEAQYSPVMEGHQNNAHTLAKGISDLVIAFKAISLTTPEEKEIIVLLQRFVEISSVLLLRLARGGGKKDTQPVDFPSMIIFMDKFIEECPLLTRESLENVLPYALLRNQFKAIYTTRGQAVKKDATDV